MAHLSRLGLFVRTIEWFLRQLERTHPKLYEKLPRFYGKPYRERSGYFADVKSSQAKRRLAASARHLFDLVDRFRGLKEIGRMKSYRLMVRLLEEQCHVEPGDPEAKVALKTPEEIPADSRKTPPIPMQPTDARARDTRALSRRPVPRRTPSR